MEIASALRKFGPVRGAAAVAGQCLVVVMAVFVAGLAPPRQGAMLLVPVSGASEGEMLSLLVAGDGRLLGSGAVPGTLVVAGARDALAGMMLRRGIVTIAAMPLLCGDASRGAARA